MQTTRLLIVFVDLSSYRIQAERVSDRELADTLNAFFRLVSATVHAAGGKTVKFIGDAALIVFPAAQVDTGVSMLFELREAVDRDMAARYWQCRLSARAHVGSAITGLFGPDDDQRFDVIGRAVNATAMLKFSGITISADAYAELSADLRERFSRDEATSAYVAA